MLGNKYWLLYATGNRAVSARSGRPELDWSRLGGSGWTQGDPVMVAPSFCEFYLGKPNQVLTENAGGEHLILLPGGGKTELVLK